MSSIVAEDSVLLKTKELCQAILERPAVQSIRQRIDTFMSDDQARAQYDALVSKGQSLQEKQQNAIALSDEEVEDFEQSRTALLANPVARNYVDAQEELHEFKHSINRYVNKTLELGRLPTEEDLSSGCCGGHGGCGCGGH